MRDTCYVEQRRFAFLMSANAMGAILEPGTQERGRDRQDDLAREGKASILTQFGVADVGEIVRAARGCGRGVRMRRDVACDYSSVCVSSTVLTSRMPQQRLLYMG